MSEPYIPVTAMVELDGFEAQFIWECARQAIEETLQEPERDSNVSRVLRKLRLQALQRLVDKFGGTP